MLLVNTAMGWLGSLSMLFEDSRVLGCYPSSA